VSRTAETRRKTGPRLGGQLAIKGTSSVVVPASRTSVRGGQFTVTGRQSTQSNLMLKAAAVLKKKKRLNAW